MREALKIGWELGMYLCVCMTYRLLGFTMEHYYAEGSFMEVFFSCDYLVFQRRTLHISWRGRMAGWKM